MSKRRNSGLMNKGLRLLVWLIFITPLGLVLSLASPLATGSVGVGCVKALSPSAQDNASDWAGEEFVVVGWPINWLELTRHKDCWQPPSGLTGFTIDWVFLALNEGILLVGIGLATWLYARLRRLRVRVLPQSNEKTSHFAPKTGEAALERP